MTLSLGIVIIVLAVLAIAKRYDVRLVLFLAALALGLVGNDVPVIIQTFFTTFANERFVVPICTAMGFAYVLRKTECDQHLVHLLVKPLTKVRWALIPGTVLVGFLVNIPVISQTSTAATLGAVVIPILMAARISPVTIGATLLLGCSIGGELFNPGAPELRTVVEETQKALTTYKGASFEASGRAVARHLLPLNFLGLFTATTVFWWMSSRAEMRYQIDQDAKKQAALESEVHATEDFKINYARALVPLLPLVLLFMTGPPLNAITVPVHWLVAKWGDPMAFLRAMPVTVPGNSPIETIPWMALLDGGEDLISSSVRGLFSSRLIGLSMLIGVAVAAAVSWKTAPQVPRAFFEGSGYAFANIISLIVTANCFGAGIRLIGLADVIGTLVAGNTSTLFVSSAALPLSFGVLCGSGMATTQSLFGFFTVPALSQGVDPTLVGAVVSLASAAGRTMSPVAAVALMCSTLTETSPFDLAKRVALPLITGIVVVVIAAILMVQFS